MSSTAATDPNGWLQPGARPGTVTVKIVNTTRDNLNDQLAVCLAYHEDRSRYVVHLTKSQQQVSLKPENLIKASWLEQMKGQYEFIQNHPDVKRNIDYYYNVIQQKTGTKPEYVAVGVGVIFLVLIYLLGFSRVLMALSFCIIVGSIVAPDVMNGASPQVIARNFPMRFRTIIRQQIPVVGPRIADNQYLSLAVMALVLVFFVNAMVRSPGRGTNNMQGSAMPSSLDLSVTNSTTTKTTTSNFGSAINRASLEDYYKLGFEDATEGNAYGTSMPQPLPDDDDEEDEISTTMPYSSGSHYGGDYNYAPHPPMQPSFISKLTNWSTMLSLAYLGRTIYSMGVTGDGGWDWQLAVANLQNMDTMRMGFLAFSVYRLVNSLLS